MVGHDHSSHSDEVHNPDASNSPNIYLLPQTGYLLPQTGENE